MSRRTRLLIIVAATTILAGCQRPTAQTDRTAEAAASVPTGGVCGGIAGVTCSAQGDFCKKPTGQCNPDAQGVCTPRPTEVRFINDPVCGCDGKTYGNEDYAHAAGVNVRGKGACSPGPQNVALPSVQIVPEIRGGVRDYCRLADRPNGKDLIVRLRNPTPLSRPALNLSVGFAGTPSPVQALSPAIPPSGTVSVRVPVPGGCLTGDCRFLIKVQDPNGAVQAEGSCLG
jgi:hypothetical protein